MKRPLLSDSWSNHYTMEATFQRGQTDALQFFPLILIEGPWCSKPEDLVIVDRI